MIFLGIDGGGTKTHALALDEQGGLVGYGVGGPSGYHTLGMEQAMAVIADVAAQALGGRMAQFAAYCLACCDSANDERLLRAALTPLQLAPRFVCCNDAFAPLRAGSRHPYGVAVICGTGFNACGLAPDGRMAKLASLGRLTGDWGGGADVGTAAVGAIFRAADGRGPPTELTAPILEALGVSDFEALADRIAVHELNAARLAALAPLVFAIADAGDVVARSIVLRLGEEIVVAALAMLRRLEMELLDVDVVLSGGLIQGQGTLLLDHVVKGLGALCPLVSVCRVSVPPVLGAVLLAYDGLRAAAPDISAIQLPPQISKASLPAC